MKAWLFGVWLFDVGAWAYNFFTANKVWQANCARLLAHIPPGWNGSYVLDLGVGPGVSTLMMSQGHPQVRFIGLDFSASMLAIANTNRIKAGWSIEQLALLRGDAQRLPLADSQIDAVTGHSFLYLLPDYRLTLKAVHRVLRSGGYIAFLEPYAGQASWSWLLRQASARLFISISLWRFYSWLHTRFSSESLRSLLLQAGFTDITTEVTLGGFGIFGRARKP